MWQITIITAPLPQLYSQNNPPRGSGGRPTRRVQTEAALRLLSFPWARPICGNTEATALTQRAVPAPGKGLLR